MSQTDWKWARFESSSRHRIISDSLWPPSFTTASANDTMASGFEMTKTAGGGGVNPPRQRDPERVAEDILDGYITTEAAREVYGMDGRIGR